MQELLVVHDWARVRRIDLYERLRSGRQFTEAEITSLVERLRRPSTVPVVSIRTMPEQIYGKLMTGHLVAEVVSGHEEIGSEYVCLCFNFLPNSIPGVHVLGGALEILLHIAMKNVVSELMSDCSGLMKPDTHLGENARQTEVSDDQATSYLFTRIQTRGC